MKMPWLAKESRLRKTLWYVLAGSAAAVLLFCAGLGLWLGYVAHKMWQPVDTERAIPYEEARVLADALSEEFEKQFDDDNPPLAPNRINYSISAKGATLIDVGRVIFAENRAVEDSSSQPMLDAWSSSSPEVKARNRIVIDEMLARWKPIWVPEQVWMRVFSVPHTAARRGTMWFAGNFIAVQVTFPAHTIDSTPVDISIGFHRTSHTFMWIYRELADGYWSLTYDRTLSAGDPLLRSGAMGPTGRDALLASSDQIASIVRKWVRESPELLIVAPRLGDALEVSRTTAESGQ